MSFCNGAYTTLPLLLALVLVSMREIVADSTGKVIRVFWVGNSLTFVNDIPGVFKNLTAAANVTVLQKQVTNPGWLLEQHAANHSGFRAEMACDSPDYFPGTSVYDYVVLQDQSQVAGGGRVFDAMTYQFPGVALGRALPLFASTFGPCIFGSTKEGSAQAVLYQTWGHLTGDKSNADLYPNFETMNQLTSLGYQMYHAQLQAQSPRPVLVARVGDVRAKIHAQYPAYHARLYNKGDDTHQSLLGAYLHACVFFRTLLPNFPLPDWAPANVSDADAALMRSIVDASSVLIV